MNWLLWREYRLNRWILITCAVGIVIPYVIGFFFLSEWQDEEF
mgnify:CR=1 FL=1